MHLSDMSNGFGDRTLTLNSVDSNVISDMSPESNVLSPTGWPRATLVCRPNSHPFQVSTFAGCNQRWQKSYLYCSFLLDIYSIIKSLQERNLQLDQSIKIGRSVARARPSATNAIFDCKVLSRNHALLWYETGKFYLQDTKVIT